MGLDCTLWQITPEKINQLKSSDEAVEEFIDFCFPEDFDEEIYYNPSKYRKFFDNHLCLGKIWDLLHYLLTGDGESTEYPLAYDNQIIIVKKR